MDQDKIDEAVLALLYLGIHQRHRRIPGARTWKSYDWDAMDRQRTVRRLSRDYKRRPARDAFGAPSLPEFRRPRGRQR